MARDPLYEQIVAGLAGHLDPTTFERCVNSLLLGEFPGLASVPGGKDSGTDGALPGQQGPVICTTADDAARNLRESLDARIAADLPGRRAVFVTSQALTAQKRFQLEQIARERAFTLEQVIERGGLAERLYRSPRWCKELLDLTGSPPALSALPRTRRPFLDLEPVGRDADLEWLLSTPGDRVLVGEPGSGKTFLLAQLAREGRGLFLASADLTEIANAVREQKPGTIFVDDAHRDPALLEHLRHLRDGEVEAEFSILATTWPGARDRITSALGELPSLQVSRLRAPHACRDSGSLQAGGYRRGRRSSARFPTSRVRAQGTGHPGREQAGPCRDARELVAPRRLARSP